MAISLLEKLNLLLKPLILLNKFSTLDLDLVSVLDCVVNQVEPVVGTSPFLLDNSHVFAKCLLRVLQLSLESLVLLFAHHLIVRLLEGYFTTQVLNFSVRLGLDARDLLLFSGSPDLVEVAEECVHEVLGYVRCAPASEVVRQAECLLWDPLVSVLVPETLFSVSCICDSARFLPGLLVWRRGLILRGRGVHVAHTGATVKGELCEVAVLFGLREEGEETSVFGPVCF